MELAQLNYLLPRLRGLGRGDEPGRRRHRHPDGRRRDEARGRPPAHPPADHEAPPRHQGDVEDARDEAGTAPGERRPAGGDRRLHERREVDPAERASRVPTSLVADQLFATLDPTVRRLKLPGGRRCTVSDTVGLRQQAPARPGGGVPFDARGGDAGRARSCTSPTPPRPTSTEQIDAVRRVLGEIGAGDIPEVLVLNKIDRVGGSERARLARRYAGSVSVSALTGEGVDGLLRDPRGGAARTRRSRWTLLVPYAREDLVARLYRDAEVLEVRRTRARGPASTPASGSASWPRSASSSRSERRRGA